MLDLIPAKGSPLLFLLMFGAFFHNRGNNPCVDAGERLG